MADQIFTIVVADDEADIREAVCNMINWEEVGFRLVGSADNGLDALQLVEQLQPDLLLTDIQMPFITGTELARQVRELQPLIQIAFLTGYDDFEYARSAIESQVISYLLKPISMAELTAALREIHDKMVSRFNEFAPARGPGSQHMTVASLLLDQNADNPGEAVLIKRLNDCGLKFKEPFSLAVVALETDSLPPEAAKTVEKVLRQYYTSCSILSGGRVLSLIISEDDLTRLGTALDELFYVGKRMLGTECVIGVSRRFSELGKSTYALREAVDAIRLSDGPGVNHISRITVNTGEAETSESLTADLDKMLFTGDRRELEEYLNGILGPNASELCIMQSLVIALNVLKSALGEDDLAQLMNSCRLSEPFGNIRDRDSFRRQVTELCLAGNEQLSQRKRDGMSLLVDRTLQIIRSRYMDETLSLNSVSDELHVSPNYLCANMKKYAGDTFINILIKKRMEVASTLIQSGGMKIGEVAQKCGYSDQHYFSYCFKKFYGVSPVKMRRGGE